MWPIIMQILRRNAPYITLPIATLVGVIGYNLESLLSDRYTPYNSKCLHVYNYIIRYKYCIYDYSYK